MSDSVSAEVISGQQSPSLPVHPWPFSRDCFDPVLDYQKDVADAFADVKKDYLARATSLYALLIGANYSNVQESVLNDGLTASLLSSRSAAGASAGLDLFAVSRVSSRTASAHLSAMPTERGRLQISAEAFRLLLSTFSVPVAFVTALARPYMVCGTGFRRTSLRTWDHWCLIPVRTVAPCRVKTRDHEKSPAGSNQLDPFHYIHLSVARADIRGSHIGLFVRHDGQAGSTTVICFNLLDHRLHDLVEEPLGRIRDAARRWSGTNVATSPRFVHMVYLSSVLRWWNNVLLCFNQELVAHEKQLQQEIAAESSAFSSESKEINTRLHIMAAHLHRYKSELYRVECIMKELQSAKFDSSITATTAAATLETSQTASGQSQDDIRIQQLISQLSTIISFSNELERKVQDILTLLFNQIQVTNDKTMQAILTAAQEDNKLSQKMAVESHQLTQSMKKDSVAMKTIAILTMIFLPGTSFAAVFAMPFFTQTQYLSAPSQVWIWTVLTFVVTLLSLGIFSRVMKRRRSATTSAERDEESGGLNQKLE